MASVSEGSNETSNTAAATALAASGDLDLRVPCFCEENVWRLAHRKLHSSPSSHSNSTTKLSTSTSQSPLPDDESRYFVAFVSNPSKCVCFFHQRANPDPTTAIFWDYHVLLLEQLRPQHDDASTVVWDMDSYLPFPCPLDEYLDHAFPDEQDDDDQEEEASGRAQILPLFRVIPAEIFLKHFSSDRSHMWDAKKKKWNATPPAYPCILAAGETKSNLMTYVDITSKVNSGMHGSVLNREELEKRFLG